MSELVANSDTMSWMLSTNSRGQWFRLRPTKRIGADNYALAARFTASTISG